jgi:hypothetical protein
MSSPNFAFVQFEFGFLLGPADGRYLRRGEGEPAYVVVLKTLGAPQRRLIGGKKPRSVTSADAEPVPTSRATIVRAEPFESGSEAEAWLGEERVDEALVELNFVLRSHRAASADPYVPSVQASQALVVRYGHGDGDQVAEGRYEAAVELPRVPRKAKRAEALAPQERLAALLGGRDQLLVGEELVLRARLDLDAGRPREAALQARVALEALLAELEERFLEPLRPLRDPVGRAANYALEGDLGASEVVAVTEAVTEMERAARRHAAARIDASGA